MTGMHARLNPGFPDPVHDSQRTFRAVLTAMARPGAFVALPALPPAPEPLPQALAAVLLTLADMDTPLWLGPSVDSPGARAWLRFHAGCPLTQDQGAAAFAATSVAGGRPLPPLEAFARGTAEYPDRSAMLILAVDALVPGRGVRLSGPGVDPDAGPALLDAQGLDPAVLRALSAENRAIYPLGLDLILTDGRGVACLPRTVRVEA